MSSLFGKPKRSFVTLRYEVLATNSTSIDTCLSCINEREYSYVMTPSNPHDDAATGTTLDNNWLVEEHIYLPPEILDAIAPRRLIRHVITIWVSEVY